MLVKFDYVVILVKPCRILYVHLEYFDGYSYSTWVFYIQVIQCKRKTIA